MTFSDPSKQDHGFAKSSPPASPAVPWLKNQLQPLLARAGSLQDAQTSAAGSETALSRDEL